MSKRRSNRDSNLLLRGSTWYVTREIPPSLREYFGKRRFTHSLKTTSKAEANRKKHPFLHDYELLFENARKGQSALDTPWKARAYRFQALTEEMIKSNLRQFETLEGYQDGQLITVTPEDQAIDLVNDFRIMEAEEIEKTHGREAAAQYYDIASGKVPIDELWPGFLNDLAPATQRDYKLYFNEFVEWTKKGTVFVEDVSYITVRDFVTGFYAKKEAEGEWTRKTISKRQSALRALWDYFITHGHALENHWRAFRLPRQRNGKRTRGPTRIAFSDEDVRRLLSSCEPKSLHHDIMLLGLLTGARIGEIAMLKVGNCNDERILVEGTKTPAAHREIPTHSMLKEVIRRRIKGRQKGDFLIREVNGTKDREDALSKRINGFRRKVIDEPGKVFHSARKWFSTKLDHAGVPDAIAHALLGHAETTVNRQVYTAGPSMKQKTAAIQKVKLPVRL